MSKYLFAFLSFALPYTPDSWAQKDIGKREQIWNGYFNQTRFTERSGIWVDLQLRLNDFLHEKSVSIARAGYTYFVSDQLRLTAGYGYITHYSPEPLVPDVPESRGWQQVQWFEKKKSLSLAQYFRVEERFVREVSNGELTDAFRFNWRFRYNFGVTIPLKAREIRAKTPFIFLNDELLINAGRTIVNNYFDQNRLFAGLGYQFTASLNAHLGYLYVFQQRPEGNRYVHINAIRFFIVHSIDLTKQ
jgi:hypothetical protein